MTDRKKQLYILIDKRADCTLVKIGKTSDSLRNRLHCYKTSNPLLNLVAVKQYKDCDNLDIKEKYYHNKLSQLGEQLTKEWFIIDNATALNIELNGFKAFNKKTNQTMYNKRIIALWKTIK